MESKRAPPDSDEHRQVERLRQFLRRFRALLFLCGVSNLAGAVAVRNARLAAFSLMMVTLAGVTFISQRFLTLGRVTAAGAIAAYGELILALTAGLLFPYGSPAVIIATLLGVAIALPYLQGRPLRWFLVASYVVVVAVLWRGFLRDPRLSLPFWLEFSAVVIGGAAGAYLLLYLLWQFTGRLRLTLERTREEHRDAEAARRRAAFLAEASRRLGDSSLDYEATLQLVAQLVVPALADYCLIDELTRHGQWRRVEALHADPSLQHLLARLHHPAPSAEHDPIRSIMATGRPTLVRDTNLAWLRKVAANEDELGALGRLGPRSAMVVPLVARGRPLGAVLLARTAPTPVYDERDLALVEEVAHRAALTADNARLYAEANNAIRARDEFLSVASHELKTPLTPLQLVVQAVYRRLPEIVGGTLSVGWLEQRFRVINRQIERLGRLVDELLDISRLVGGKFRLELEWVDLTEVVREVAERFQGLDGAAQPVQLNLEIAEGVRGRWDRLRLEQVFTNLISNAMKYGSGQPIDIAMTSDGSLASLAVTDHGIGIAADDQRRIFERFERASTAAHMAGLGLGLFIARQIVEALGGTIRVASELGRGATFTVELPIAGPSEDVIAEARP